MDEGTASFIEKTGLLFESQGVSRSAGRIVASLLVSPVPLALDELASGLRISKGSVSTNTRLLETFGLIEKVSLRGDRRIYYRIAEDVWFNSLKRSTVKIQAFIDLARSGQASIPENNEIARQRLSEMEAFYRALLEKTSQWIEELQRKKGSGPESGG